jgi:hypothetical protein
MEREILSALLAQIKGCSFANLDTETVPTPGIRKIVTGQRVIMFTNTNCSGYENMVKRRLLEAGKNPENFVLGDLPWGTRVPNSPLIEHKGKTYLQVISLSPGLVKYVSLTGREIDDPEAFGIRERPRNQGLGADSVDVCCYNLDNIIRIALMGEELVSDRKDRAILRISS